MLHLNLPQRDFSRGQNLASPSKESVIKTFLKRAFRTVGYDITRAIQTQSSLASRHFRAALDLLSCTIRSRLSLALLAIDCAFILLHIFVATRPWETPGSAIQYLRIDKEGGVAEIFETALLLAGLTATAVLIRRTNDAAYWMVAALILYLLIDNSLGIHESLGPILQTANPAIGEALPSLVAAAIFVPWGLVSVWRSSGLTSTVLTAFGLTVSYIAFFGVGVDALHRFLILPHTPLDGAVTVLEDGNELIGLTVLGTLMLTVLGKTRSHDKG